MNREILSIVDKLFLASAEEIYSALNSLLKVSKKSLESCLSKLEQDLSLIKIYPNENADRILGYIIGPENAFQKVNLDLELSPRNHDIIDWNLLSKRISGEFEDRINSLEEDIVKKYRPFKDIELEYFDLCINFFRFNNYLKQYGAALPTSIFQSIKSIKQLLDKIGAP